MRKSYRIPVARNSLLVLCTSMVPLLYGAEEKNARPVSVSKLDLGDAYLNANDFDKAIETYAAEVTSNNPVTAASAKQRLEAALDERRRDADGLKWPVIQWIRNYSLELMLVGGIALVFWWLVCFLSRLFLSDPWKCRWKVKMHTAWTQEVPTDIFLAEFRNALAELSELNELLGGTPFANRLRNPIFDRDRLLITLDVGDTIKQEQVVVQGIDIGLVHKLYIRTIEHLTWVLDIRVVKLNVIYAYATLRIRNRTVANWHVPHPYSQSPADVRDAARQLAFEVFSKDWTRS